MRGPTKSILLAISLACPLLYAQAQDPAKIADQYIKAAGGSKALSIIQTLTLEGTFTNSADGKSGTYTFDTKLPNRYYSELVVGDKNVIEAYNGKSAWHQSTAGDPGTLLGEEGLQLEAASSYYNSRFLNLKKNKLALAFVGHAQVRGKDALQVEVTAPTGVKRQVFFDPQSHLIVKESGALGGINEEIYYDDYRAVERVMVPYKIELHRGSEVYAIVVTRVAINGTVGERVFDFPMKSQVRLPDLKALFKEIDDNQKAIDKLKENYAGTRVEEETDFEKDGQVKKTEVKEYTFFYLNGDEVSTLVKKDGKALSDDEQKKENEKTQKEIEEIQKREAKKKPKTKKPKRKERKIKTTKTSASSPSYASRSSSILAANASAARKSSSSISSPIPNTKPATSRKKSSRNLLASSGLTSKRTTSPVSKLISSVISASPAASSANLQKGTSFIFEQAYLNNEIWLPTYAEVHVGVRVLLVKGLTVNETIRYTDYKRFNVETLSTINKPKGAVDTPPTKPQNLPDPNTEIPTTKHGFGSI